MNTKIRSAFVRVLRFASRLVVRDAHEYTESIREFVHSDYARKLRVHERELVISSVLIHTLS